MFMYNGVVSFDYHVFVLNTCTSCCRWLH